LGIQNDREWTRFCADVLGAPELARDDRFADNPQRVANRAELTRMIEGTFATMTVDDVVRRLDSAGIANGRLNDMHDFAAHAQLRTRDRWRPIATEKGEIDALLPPAALNGVEPTMAAVPRVGQHNDAVLDELGYDHATIDSLRAGGAI
jgi:crotonobetainyl-CoA:carnitine CoA-transferase CaiB-like acyl-CoA transferase